MKIDKKNNFFGDFERAMELDFEKKLSRIRVQDEKRLAQIAIDRDRELARIKAEHDQKMSQIQAEHDQKMSQLQAEHDQKMSQLQAEHDQKMSRMQAEYNLEVTSFEAEAAKKLAEIKSRAEAADALRHLGFVLLGIKDSREVQKMVQTIKSHPLLKNDTELQTKLKSLKKEDGRYYLQKAMEI